MEAAGALGEKKSFRIGEVVEEPVFARLNGGAPILLLAAGQRISTSAQVARLREAGFRVLGEQLERSRPEPVRTEVRAELEQQAVVAAQNQAMEVAREHRERVQRATRDIMARVASEDPLDLGEAMEVSSFVVGQVAADPVGLVALASLRQCDNYTIDHSSDVSILMVAIAHRLGWDKDRLRELAIAGLVHDVGKQRIGKDLLDKQGALSPAEFDLVKRHPEWGLEYVLRTNGCPECLRQVTLRHHERLDGSGYPNGLSGDAIDPASRIAAVANAFDSWTSHRPYRQGLSPREALRQLYAGRGSLYDATAVDALVKLVGVYPVGTNVMLNNGECATVVSPNPRDTTRPLVRIWRDRVGLPLPKPRLVALEGTPLAITGVVA